MPSSKGRRAPHTNRDELGDAQPGQSVGSEVETPPPEKHPHRSTPGIPAKLALPAAVLVATVLLLRWDSWFVNWDGGQYMALARSLLDGDGYRFPDGSFAAFRGPVYSVLVALSWLIGPDTAKTAIWASRFLLVVNAALVGWLITRFARRRWIAVGGLLAAFAQPLPLVSGGLFFVPDGLAALWVLAALALVWSTRARRLVRVAGSGLLAGLAVLTKESYLLLAIPVFAALVFIDRDRPPSSEKTSVNWYWAGLGLVVLPWMTGVWWVTGSLPPPVDAFPPLVVLLTAGAVVGAAVWLAVPSDRLWRRIPTWVWLVTAAVVPIGALSLTAAPLAVELNELTGIVGRDLSAELYRPQPLWLVVVPVLVALLVVLTRAHDGPSRGAAALFLSGASLLVYGAGAFIGIRNGVLAAYAAVLLVARALDWAVERARWPVAALVGLTAITLLTANFLAAERVDDRWLTPRHTWDAVAPRSAAVWLTERAAGESVLGTPVFLTTMWLESGAFDPVLIPYYVADSAGGKLSYDRIVNWGGHLRVPGEPPEQTPIGMNVGRRITTAVFGEHLASAVSDRTIKFVIATGNLAEIASAFDGGILLPYLESQPNLRRVHQSSAEELPQWVIVYEVVGPLSPETARPLVHETVDGVAAAVTSDQVVVDSLEYQAMILELLGEPLPAR